VKKIFLFVPCYIDHLYPNQGEKMISLLEHIGYNVDVPAKQPCCGQLAYNNGYFDEAKRLAEKWSQFFYDKQPLIVGGASCTYMIKNIYPELLPSTKLSLMFVEDILSFLARHPLPELFSPKKQGPLAVHQSCTGMRKLYNGKNLLFDILSSFQQLQVIQTSVDSQCCGFGGTFSIHFPELSTDMGTTKLEGVIQAGAKQLIVSDISCYMQLNSLVEKHHFPIQIRTIIDFLFDSIHK